MQSNPEVLEKLERCLTKFGAREVADIIDNYTYYPNFMSSKLGSGSYGEAFRMKSVTNTHAKPVVVKAIPKARVSRTMLQVQHLCAELAVTGFVNHSNINKREELLHSKSHIYLVLELCEGQKPDPLTRLYLLLAKYNPARYDEAEDIVKGWNAELEGQEKSDSEREVFYDGKINDFMSRQLGVRKEPPISYDLFNCIVYHKRLPERKAKIILKQIMQGLEHLHTNSIVHRDMKTENVVIAETRKAIPIRDENGKVTAIRIEERIDTKLIDFGLVKYMNLTQFPTSPSPSNFGANSNAFGGSANAFAQPDENPFGGASNTGGASAFGQPGQGFVGVTPCGTEVYCALEVIQGILSSGMGRTKWQSHRDQLPKLDVYGAGTIMFCMCNGRPPFRVNNTYRQTNREEKVRQIQKLIADGPVFSASCPESAKQMTQLLMHNDQGTRPTAADTLRLDYFNGIGATYVYEVSCSGEVTEIVEDPSTGVGSRQSSLITEEPKPAEEEIDGAEVEATSPTDETTDGGDEIDFMAAMRGKEDGEADYKERVKESSA